MAREHRKLAAILDADVVGYYLAIMVPPKVEYRLTPVGRSFVPVINAIHKWGERHLSGT